MRQSLRYPDWVKTGSIWLVFLGWAASVWADDVPARPSVMFNRWQEDWSVLANPDVPREPFDELKYIPLSQDDPDTYLSLGANLRERFETNDAADFGTSGNHADDYLISRLEVDSDLRVAGQVQVFAQLQSDYAIGKNMHSPVDQDRLDLEQGFLAITEPLGDGTLKVRLGRQQFGFDLQRFVSVRDGPNVRQSYDAAWVDYEIGKWRFISFFSHPVQDRDIEPFDDYSSTRLSYGGVRAERQLTSSISVSTYVSRFVQDGAHWISAAGDERRDIVDVRFNGVQGGLDWDVEGMSQTGRIGARAIHAWAFGSLSGWTWHSAAFKPRIGLQVDAASGDKNPSDGQLNTFNPLFPNGYYVTLSGYTGYVNFIHVKPSFTIQPIPTIKVMAALGLQWRETTADAVYAQPTIPIADTAGEGGAYTGTYGQLRADYAYNGHLSFAVELVRFEIGDTVRAAGGHDSNYAGVEVRAGW
jgi:hypothetical protein